MVADALVEELAGAGRKMLVKLLTSKPDAGRPFGWFGGVVVAGVF